MLTPDYLDRCTDDIVALYGGFQDKLLEDMARRFVRLEGITQATVNQAELAQQAGLVYRDVVSRVARLTYSSEQEMRALFRDAGVRALEYDDGVYRAAGLHPLPLKQSPALLNLLVANAGKTGRELQNLTMTTAVTTQTAFIQAAGMAQQLVSSGAMDLHFAVRDALKALARQGVTVVRYNNRGRRPKADLVDVATRRAVLTGVNQTAAALQIIRMDEVGWDLVETTAHLGARPDHMTWQGRVFSRSGRGYPDFEASTGYGQGWGLCGWNCRHNFFPHYIGVSPRTYTDRELRAIEERTVLVDGEKIPLYRATQIQRDMEVHIRATKRELIVLNTGALSVEDDALAAVLKDDFIATSQTLKALERALQGLVRQVGLARQREQEQVLGFGRSVAHKAVWEDKKARGIAQKIHD